MKMKIEEARAIVDDKGALQPWRMAVSILVEQHYEKTHGPLLEVARSMFEILEGRGCQDEEAWARKIKDAETVEVPE